MANLNAQAENSIPANGKKGNVLAKKYNFCNTQLRTSTEKFTWKIDNFRGRREENGDCMESSSFILLSPSGAEIKWRLLLFPDGDEDEARGYISLYLKLVDSKGEDGPIWAKSNFSIRDAKQNELIKRGNGGDFDKYGEGGYYCWGYPTLISQDRLLNEEDGLLHGDQLTIICEVTVQEESIKRASLLDIEIPECRALEDMGQLFEESLFTDCHIIAGDGKEFKAHKGILSCRSRYFAAMFKHGMEEAQNNTVRIKDIPSDVLGQMLRFIYSGTASKLDEMAEELLEAADKYQLDRLKILCERHLARSMEIDNACILLLLANRLSSEHLKAHAFKFIQLNAKEVMDTNGWKMLIKGNNGELFDQLMKSMISFVSST